MLLRYEKPDGSSETFPLTDKPISIGRSPDADIVIDDETDGLMVVLRDPSGRIADDVAVKSIENGFYSRESDGWGVWRWCTGSPGSPNGKTGQFSFTSLLLSIVVSSLKEAWEEAYSIYGLTFQTLTHFVERAIDLFIERALSAIGELVLDVRLFIEVKIAAGAGVSAGLGIELSFLAEGDAVARFLQWVYENVKIFLDNIMNPGGSGDYTRFPLEILSDCHLEASFFFDDIRTTFAKSLTPVPHRLEQYTLHAGG